jgi:hypothetical protein
VTPNERSRRNAVPASFGSAITPGSFVRHPDRPDWGLGQVQSSIGSRITVNFEHAGKVLVNASLIALEPVSEIELEAARPRPRSGSE